MNTRTSLTRMSTLVAVIGCAFAGTHVFAQDEAVMSVDDRAPLQATLLPTVSVVADAAYPDAESTWSVADTRPLPVTLMPTVRVTAQAEPLVVTLMPTITVTAQADLLVATAQPDVRFNARAHAVAQPAPPHRTGSTLAAARSNVDSANASDASGRNLQVVPR